MTQLKSLTFAALPKLSSDPVTHRRNKLIGRLRDQISLANDPNFTLTRSKWIADEHGVKQLRELKRRVKPWWRTTASGDFILKVVYGARAITFEKDKAGIAVGKKENLIPVLETLIRATESSELDAILAQMSKSAVLPKGKRAA